MLRKFIAGSVLAQAFVRDERSGPERLAASPWASATTPEQLIVAHIVHDYARNPQNWKEAGSLPTETSEKVTNEHHYRPSEYRSGDKTTWFRVSTGNFRMTDGKAVVQVVKSIRNQDGDGCAPWIERHLIEVSSATSKDTPIVLSEALSVDLLKVLRDLAAKKRQAEEVAIAAKKAMEQNERSWNLAEQLLGMKRNEQGALVPKEAEDVGTS